MSCRLKLLVIGWLIASAGLPSCRKRAEEGQQGRARQIQRAEHATPQRASKPERDVKPASARTDDALPFVRLGIPECDGYLIKYRACIASRIPTQERAALLASLGKTAEAWRQAAATDSGRIQLKAACQMAYVAAKAAMRDYGCAW